MPMNVSATKVTRDWCGAGLPLLVQHFLQQASALPVASPTAVQARALRGQREGAQAAPRGPAGGGLAHLASQPLDLVQAQEPFGPRILPQLLPEGFQAWREANEDALWASTPQPRTSSPRLAGASRWWKGGRRKGQHGSDG